MALAVEESKPARQEQAPPDLERALAREALRSEHLRLTILAAVTAVALGGPIAARSLVRELAAARIGRGTRPEGLAILMDAEIRHVSVAP